MVLLWGSSFPVLERLLETWDVLSVTAGRHFIGACTMVAILRAGCPGAGCARVSSNRG